MSSIIAKNRVFVNGYHHHNYAKNAKHEFLLKIYLPVPPLGNNFEGDVMGNKYSRDVSSQHEHFYSSELIPSHNNA